MQLDSDQLKQHLTKTLAPIYVLVGDEPLALSECLDSIRESARQAGADERSSFIVERNFNWQQINQFSQSMSLFSAKRILEIHIPNGKPGVDGGKALTELSANLIADTTTIIVLPTLERDAKNSAWFGVLQKVSVVIDLKEISPAHLPQWLAARLALQNQSTDAISLAFIAHQVEGNLLAAHQEIQKLGLLYPAGEISHEAVREAVLNVSRFDAFQLGDAVLMGDKARVMSILQGLKDEGENVVAVMSPLMWVLRPLVRIKQAEARKENIMTAMNNARIYGDRQNLIKRALSRLSLRQMEAALQKLCDIDKTAKGVMEGDAWLELSRLCFGLAKVRAVK
ncbi:MAG: DNA polymerase III subunit delta [Pseudomonadota bacterium]